MVGASSDKHALSFGARAALARTDSTRPVLWAVHRSGAKWGHRRALAPPCIRVFSMACRADDYLGPFFLRLMLEEIFLISQKR